MFPQLIGSVNVDAYEKYVGILGKRGSRTILRIRYPSIPSHLSRTVPLLLWISGVVCKMVKGHWFNDKKHVCVRSSMPFLRYCKQVSKQVIFLFPKEIFHN